MKNPNPILRAWRLEKRRKELGSNDPQCLYCPENDLACMEVDHPVTEELDEEFKQMVCCNHHKKLEMKRDLAELTKNGLHTLDESERDKLRRYLLLLAEHLESIATISPDNIAAALRAAAASLRRKAATL